MLHKNILKLGVLAIAVALGMPALALNPQPEPPQPYRGYEYIIDQSGPGEWHWEIRRHQIGALAPVLNEGSIRGTHERAVLRARRAIDRLSGTSIPH